MFLKFNLISFLKRERIGNVSWFCQRQKQSLLALALFTSAHSVRVQSSGVDKRVLIKDIMKYWKKELKKFKISEPEESVKIILAHVLQLQKFSDIIRLKNKELSDKEIETINGMFQKRLQKMPVQYIIGEWDFCGLNIEITPPILIPRPESETLVEIVSEEIIKNNFNKVLEIGCGSGVISLSLIKKFPLLNITAIDKSKEACELTHRNLKRNRITTKLNVKKINITENNFRILFDERFEIIVSNPPYIPSSRMQKLQSEILMYEDHEALDGGHDGLNIIKLILQMAPYVLVDNGIIFLEVDITHPKIISSWLLNSNLNLSFVRCHKDLYGRERFVEIIYKEL